MEAHHRLQSPEATIVDWAERLPPQSRVLDVAAGGGRHALWLATRGHQVTAIDRDTQALRAALLKADKSLDVRILETDLEAEPWPVEGELFDAVVVVNYLHRELLPALFAAVAPSGHLLYETFAVGNERFGRPRNPDYLLRDSELLTAAPPHFEILEFAQSAVGEPPTAIRQKMLAKRAL